MLLQQADVETQVYVTSGFEFLFNATRTPRPSLRRSVKNINVLLKSDNIPELFYSTKIFIKRTVSCSSDLDEELYENNEWVKSNTITTESLILLSIDIPNFQATDVVSLNGAILFERSAEKYQEPLKEITLSVHDIHDNLYAVRTNDVIQGQDEAYFTVVASSIIVPVKIKIPDGTYRTLDGLLQLDCNFNKVEIVGRRKVYLYDGNSEILAGVMIENLDGTNLELFLRKNDQLHHLLHLVYKNIPGVVLFNENCEPINDVDVSVYMRGTQSFLMDSKPTDRTNVDNFLESLDKQMDIILRTCGVTQESDESHVQFTQRKYKNFRHVLTECEKETDYFYSKLNDNKK